MPAEYSSNTHFSNQNMIELLNWSENILKNHIRGNFVSGVGDCCWPVMSPAGVQPGRALRLSPDSSGDQWSAGRERSPAPCRYEQPIVVKCEWFFFTCYAWHLFCVVLTALIRFTSCCEETARRLLSGSSAVAFQRSICSRFQGCRWRRNTWVFYHLLWNLKLKECLTDIIKFPELN